MRKKISKNWIQAVTSHLSLTTSTISSMTYTKFRNTLNEYCFYSENDTMDIVLNLATLNDVMEGNRCIQIF